MNPYEVSIGALDIVLEFPDGVLTAMLPAWLVPVEAPVFPSRRLRLRFLPLEEAPAEARSIAGRFGLGRAFCLESTPSPAAAERDWTFFVPLSFGPERPDRLPTRCVLPSLSIALESEGVHAVHASAVVRDRKALVIAGPSGRGKSTAAAALAERGWSPLADDRVLLVSHDGAWWATASPERPNPFARRVGYPAERGPVPRRVVEDRGAHAVVAGLVFPNVMPDEPSSLSALSKAQATGLLAAAGGPPAVPDSAPPATDASAVSASLPALPPAVRLTLGRGAATIFDQLQASFSSSTTP